MNYELNSDLEKVFSCPPAENSEIYNVLKIACLVTKDNTKYVWHDELLKS